MSNDTRQQIADAEWASVERDALLCLDELAKRASCVSDDRGEREAAVYAYIEGLKARHERALLAVRAELDALRSGRLAEADREHKEFAARVEARMAQIARKGT